MPGSLPPPPLPAYGSGSLAQVMSAVVAALGSGVDARAASDLDLEPMDACVLLVVDGLGWELLLEHRADAPFLARHLDAARPITSGYPSSTATSLAMLSTGRPPIAHGITGYTMAAPGLGRAMNNLAWTTHGPDARDLRAELPPEVIQPLPTVFARSLEVGVRMTAIGPAEHAGSGLTRAILRGGPFVPVESMADGTAVDKVLAALDGHGPAAVYAYDPVVDGIGHRHGPGSNRWRNALGRIDDVARRLAEALPRDAVLIVTADHGMVDLSTPQARRVEISERPELAAGVRFLAGEARARHVHCDAGEAEAVLARWQAALGDVAWILSRDDAIDAGWFGPAVELREAVRERIGDVVCAAAGPIGVFQRLVDPGEASLVGHHGSFTSAEQLVPWIAIRR